MNAPRLSWTPIPSHHLTYACALGYILEVHESTMPADARPLKPYTVAWRGLHPVHVQVRELLGDYADENAAKRALETWLAEQVKELGFVPKDTAPTEAGVDAKAIAELALVPGLEAVAAFLEILLPYLDTPQEVELTRASIEGNDCGVILLNAKRRVGVRVTGGPRFGMVETTTGTEDELTNWSGGATSSFGASQMPGCAQFLAEAYFNQ